MLPLLLSVLGLPLVKSAVIVWPPTARVDVLTDACPLPSTVCALPRSLPSALNCTVPETAPPPCRATVAVKVTLCPNFDGFAEDATPVLLGLAGGGLTRWFALGGTGQADAVVGTRVA